MKIVIFSESSDYHAQSVIWGLEQLGHDGVIISNYYNESHHSTYHVNDQYFNFNGITVNPEDTVWFRRPQAPVVHKDVVSADEKFVKNEIRDSLLCSLHCLSKKSFTINNYSQELLYDVKAMQLNLARELRFNVPETLITNSPSEARRFIRAQSGHSIYKSFTQHFWENKKNDTLAFTEAMLVDLEAIADDFTVESCPLLLQQYIDKDFDVRVLVMGKFYFSVAIVNDNGSAPVDWRPAFQNSTVMLKRIELPDDVKQKIDGFMKSSGLVFGSFDFSVDKKGLWWFLEINTQGQFLWLEDNTNYGLLENFCRFVIEQNPSFEGMVGAGKDINHDEFKRSDRYQQFLQNKKNTTEESIMTRES